MPATIRRSVDTPGWFCIVFNDIWRGYDLVERRMYRDTMRWILGDHHDYPAVIKEPTK